MSVYLQHDTVTKQYLKGLTSGSPSGGGSGGTITPTTSGFMMTGNINMGGHEIMGLDSPHSGSSAMSKKYVEDNFLSSSDILTWVDIGVPNMHTSATNKKDVDDKVLIALSTGGLSPTQWTWTLTI